MKKIFFVLMILFLLPSVLAVNLNIEHTGSDEVMILDFDEATTFNLKITNNGASDDFLFYTFFGVLEEPTTKIHIDSGQTKDVQLKILPSYILNSGYSTFDVFVRGNDESESSIKLLVRVIDLKDAFDVGASEINPESNSITVFLRNKVNFNFENIDAKLSSVFFDLDETFSLGPEERKTFEVNLDGEDFNKITAGFYTVRAKINTYGKQTEIEGTIKFAEKDILTISKQDYGFIVRTHLIEKTNEGNVVQSSETVIKKNIISRLFTTLNPEPDFVERKGLTIYYNWVREIAPGETLNIKIKTNWFLPFLIIFLIIAVVVFVKQYLKTDLTIRKKVSFVKAKGGEFALKISLIIHAKKFVEKVNIIDNLPALTKIYERFGKEVPTRVDEDRKKIEWNFDRLEPGEIRVLSYIIYSKVGVIGKFALPSATVIYEKDGKIQDTQSNMAFFMAEQRTKEPEEY